MAVQGCTPCCVDDDVRNRTSDGLPPCRVSVENEYSVSVAPASLCAATNRVYHVAGDSEHMETGCCMTELEDASNALETITNRKS